MAGMPSLNGAVEDDSDEAFARSLQDQEIREAARGARDVMEKETGVAVPTLNEFVAPQRIAPVAAAVPAASSFPLSSQLPAMPVAQHVRVIPLDPPDDGSEGFLDDEERQRRRDLLLARRMNSEAREAEIEARRAAERLRQDEEMAKRMMAEMEADDRRAKQGDRGRWRERGEEDRRRWRQQREDEKQRRMEVEREERERQELQMSEDEDMARRLAAEIEADEEMKRMEEEREERAREEHEWQRQQEEAGERCHKVKEESERRRKDKENAADRKPRKEKAAVAAVAATAVKPTLERKRIEESAAAVTIEKKAVPHLSPVERQRAVAAVIKDASLSEPEKRAQIKSIMSGKAGGQAKASSSGKVVAAAAAAATAEREERERQERQRSEDEDTARRLAAEIEAEEGKKRLEEEKEERAREEREQQRRRREEEEAERRLEEVGRQCMADEDMARRLAAEIEAEEERKRMEEERAREERKKQRQIEEEEAERRRQEAERQRMADEEMARRLVAEIEAEEEKKRMEEEREERARVEREQQWLQEEAGERCHKVKEESERRRKDKENAADRKPRKEKAAVAAVAATAVKPTLERKRIEESAAAVTIEKKAVPHLSPVERQRAVAAVIKDASLSESEKRAQIKSIISGEGQANASSSGKVVRAADAATAAKLGRKQEEKEVSAAAALENKNAPLISPSERQRAVAAVIKDASLSESEKRAQIKDVMSGRARGRAEVLHPVGVAGYDAAGNLERKQQEEVTATAYLNEKEQEAAAEVTLQRKKEDNQRVEQGRQLKADEELAMAIAAIEEEESVGSTSEELTNAENGNSEEDSDKVGKREEENHERKGDDEDRALALRQQKRKYIMKSMRLQERNLAMVHPEDNGESAPSAKDTAAPSDPNAKESKDDSIGASMVKHFNKRAAASIVTPPSLPLERQTSQERRVMDELDIISMWADVAVTEKSENGQSASFEDLPDNDLKLRQDRVQTSRHESSQFLPRDIKEAWLNVEGVGHSREEGRGSVNTHEEEARRQLMKEEGELREYQEQLRLAEERSWLEEEERRRRQKAEKAVQKAEEAEGCRWEEENQRIEA